MTEKALAKIRRFKIEDIDRILDIEQQAFPKTAYSKGTFLTYASSFPDTFVVAETGGDIVGYIIFDMSGHVHSTAVESTYRTKGFGKMLFMYALRCAEKGLWLEVRSKNTGAIEFYRKLGMKVVRRISDYYGSDDALVMTLSQSQ